MSNEAKCNCQYCNEHISFPTEMVGQTVACPHCHLETKLFVPPPQVSAQPPKFIKGTILDYTIQTNAGVISGDDGQRYSFRGAEWRETEKHPAKGMRVDFSPQAGYASGIYLIQNAPNAPSGITGKYDCSHVTAGLLGLFLGCFGSHKFYMGDKNTGKFYLCISMLGSFFCLLGCGGLIGFVVIGLPPLLIIAMVSSIEGIVYLSMPQIEFETKFLNPVEPFKISKTLVRWLIIVTIVDLTIIGLSLAFD